MPQTPSDDWYELVTSDTSTRTPTEAAIETTDDVLEEMGIDVIDTGAEAE